MGLEVLGILGKPLIFFCSKQTRTYWDRNKIKIVSPYDLNKPVVSRSYISKLNDHCLFRSYHAFTSSVSSLTGRSAA